MHQLFRAIYHLGCKLEQPQSCCKLCAASHGPLCALATCPICPPAPRVGSRGAVSVGSVWVFSGGRLISPHADWRKEAWESDLVIVTRCSGQRLCVSVSPTCLPMAAASTGEGPGAASQFGQGSPPTSPDRAVSMGECLCRLCPLGLVQGMGGGWERRQGDQMASVKCQDGGVCGGE